MTRIVLWSFDEPDHASEGLPDNLGEIGLDFHTHGADLIVCAEYEGRMTYAFRVVDAAKYPGDVQAGRWFADRYAWNDAAGRHFVWSFDA